MSYYSPGDKVTYMPTGDSATVAEALPNEEYVIEFDSVDLIPPKMTVNGNRLSPKPITLYGGYGYMPPPPQQRRFDELQQENKPVINKETNCPRCGKLWKETIIGQKAFYDCLKCVLRKEDA